MLNQNKKYHETKDKNKIDTVDRFLKILWRKEVEYKLNSK